MPRDEPALQDVMHMDDPSIYSSMLSVLLKNSSEASQSPSRSVPLVCEVSAAITAASQSECQTINWAKAVIL